MDIRGKLVELIFDSLCRNIDKSCKLAENIADDLISNGVTAQEWISVKDRLPQEDGSYLVTTNCFGNRQGINIRCFAKDGETVDEYDLAGQKYVWYFYDSECGYASTKYVTHWMPLPEPPNGARMDGDSDG